MYSAIQQRAIQHVPVRYGWVVMVGMLLFLITLFLCQGSHGNDVHVHIHESKTEINNNEQPVIVTYTKGVISAYTQALENNRYEVVSDSSVPVDAVVKTEDGNILFTIEDLLPSGSFCFETEEPCVVTVVAG